MNKDEIRGRIEHAREKSESEKHQAKKILERIRKVTGGEQLDMKLVQFLRDETDRLEERISSGVVLDGEIEKLSRQYREMPEDASWGQ